METAGRLDDIDRFVSALADPTRRYILLGFYRDSGVDRSVDEVSRATGVHRTVAFTHLERLVSLGLLDTAKRRGKPGKPAKLYRLAPGRLDFSYPPRRFAELATFLADALLSLGDAGTLAARSVGRRQGALMVQQPAASVEAVLRSLGQLNAEYTVDGNRVIARNCIFLETCTAAPRMPCELQAGLLEGALGRAGITRRVTALGNQGSGCGYRLDGEAA